MNMLRIPYESERFPPGTVQSGTDELSVTWGNILWAATTVGRPDRYSVFRHGNASIHEALFRWSLIRMTLEQRTPTDLYLQRTNAAKTLDPTEKGAVSYFLGMTFCKLFAAKLLHTPWLVHLDVCRPQLDPILSGRSRPDLVGQEHGSNRWHGFECKGRVSPTNAAVKTKAKNQAQRLVSVNNTKCSMHVGAITYFSRDTLHFYWQDPFPDEGDVIEVNLPLEVWRYYYRPIVEIIKNRDIGTAIEHDDSVDGIHVYIEGYDIELLVHQAIWGYLLSEEWERARIAAIEAEEVINEIGYQLDGLLMRAGKSWCERHVNYPYSD